MTWSPGNLHPTTPTKFIDVPVDWLVEQLSEIFKETIKERKIASLLGPPDPRLDQLCMSAIDALGTYMEHEETLDSNRARARCPAIAKVGPEPTIEERVVIVQSLSAGLVDWVLRGAPGANER